MASATMSEVQNCSALRICPPIDTRTDNYTGAVRGSLHTAACALAAD
jgi:hypothetical protein